MKRPNGHWSKDKRFMLYVKTEKLFAVRNIVFFCAGVACIVFSYQFISADFPMRSCMLLVFPGILFMVLGIALIMEQMPRLLMNRRKLQEYFYAEINK